MDQPASTNSNRNGVIRLIPGRRARNVLGWLGIVIGLIGIVTTVIELRTAARQSDVLRRQTVSFRRLEKEERTGKPASVEAVWEGRTFRKCDVVRIAEWAGTFKPQETGSRDEVDADYGHSGILLSGERRAKSDSAASSTEPVQIVRVRWTPQKWKINGQDRWVELAEFDATIHVSYLEVVR